VRLGGVSAEWFVRFEVSIALDWEAKATAHGGQFRERDVIDFGAAEAKVAKAEGGVLVCLQSVMKREESSLR
jgi:hypothetical protein